MNREISLKKFIIVLFLVLVVLSIVLFFILRKTKPLCHVNTKECKNAICTKCQESDNQKFCSSCSLFDKENNRIWTGSCIFNN